MILHKNGSRPSVNGPAEWFTGRVRIDPLHLQAAESSRVTAGLVAFEPGARTHWHTHPLGQLLIVTAGFGWTQCEHGERIEVSAGDTGIIPYLNGHCRRAGLFRPLWGAANAGRPDAA